EAIHQRGVSDIALDDVQPARPSRVDEVLVAPAHEVVHDDDALSAGFEHLIDDEGANEACAAGDENPSAAEVSRHLFSHLPTELAATTTIVVKGGVRPARTPEPTGRTRPPLQLNV